ncbi:MAG: hypothetical protein ACFFDI_07540 [Promethearchaeota archaeon]
MSNWYLRSLRRKKRTEDRGYLSKKQYDRIDSKPYYLDWDFHWSRKYTNRRDITKNRHHNGTARKLLYRRQVQLKLKP